MNKFVCCLASSLMALCLNAQDVKEIEFCDKQYEYGVGKDSITLFLKVLDSDGNRSKLVNTDDLKKNLAIFEDGSPISDDRRRILSLDAGQRIPSDYTFSVLIDLTIPESGKEKIYEAVERLVNSASDSCVFISFFGEEVSSSQLITKQNCTGFKSHFLKNDTCKFFYGALYSKLAEFGGGVAELESSVKTKAGYSKNRTIRERASKNNGKNLLFVFTEGNRKPEFENITFREVTSHQEDVNHVVPKVYAFYYSVEGIDKDVEATLMGVTSPRDSLGNVIKSRKGDYKPSDNLNDVLNSFEETVQHTMYDFAFIYKATKGRIYRGKTVFDAEWNQERKGNVEFSIGTEENPWPTEDVNTVGIAIKYSYAIIITLLTIVVFFCVMKILIPFVKSKFFSLKYYKKYVPEENVQRRICHFCRQDIQPGQMVVARCKHIMHVACWEQNGYKCAEYGQNCKTGIQEHIEWKELLTKAFLKDCYQAIAGICAGLFSWIFYELLGRGSFSALSRGIVKVFLTNEQQASLFDNCVTKVSAFLTIGLLLGFFLSLIFRYNEEYGAKNWKVYAKIAGLSFFSCAVGIGSFAIGAIFLCTILSMIHTTYIPWYCSFPAYILFSICTSLSLTVKSSIPVRSAMIGGICSAIIGFFVLYFSTFMASRYGWMNMLLDFVIYGGGLGASLVTVRMLAEKYFLIIQNGIKAGQKIPIHKWMSATGGGNKVSIGMTGDCEIQMSWEKSNKVAKEHAQLFVDPAKQLPMIKPLATGVIFNTRAELPVNKPSVLSNGDTFKIGDTIFKYVETD